MVVTSNLIAHLFVLASANTLHMLDNGTALRGVSLHNFKLFFSQATGLKQNAVTNSDFTHIVQSASSHNHINSFLRESILRIALGQLLC